MFETFLRFNTKPIIVATVASSSQQHETIQPQRAFTSGPARTFQPILAFCDAMRRRPRVRCLPSERRDLVSISNRMDLRNVASDRIIREMMRSNLGYADFSQRHGCLWFQKSTSSKSAYQNHILACRRTHLARSGRLWVIIVGCIFVYYRILSPAALLSIFAVHSG